MLFFESKDTDVFKADRNKLFASNEKQIESYALMLHSCMAVVLTYHCRGVLKKIVRYGFCSLLIFAAKKS